MDIDVDIVKKMDAKESFAFKKDSGSGLQVGAPRRRPAAAAGRGSAAAAAAHTGPTLPGCKGVVNLTVFWPNLAKLY